MLEYFLILISNSQNKKAKIEAENFVVELTGKSGADGRLFGAVSTKQIVAALAEQKQLKIDKRKLSLNQPIHSLGYTDVPLKLHREVTANLRVHVSEG